MLCLGKFPLETKSLVIASLLNLFVYSPLFSSGACSVCPWAKPRSLVCAGWCVGYLGSLHH